MELSFYGLPIAEFISLEKNPNEIDLLLLHSFNENAHNLSIIHDGEIVGLLCINHQYNSFHIANLYLLTEFRSKGLGKIVLDQLKNENEGRVITCCPFSNESEKFFVREGFLPNTGDIEEYYYLTFKNT